MNKKQLMGLGVPEDCISQAIACVQIAARDKEWEKPRKLLAKLVAAPEVYHCLLYTSPSPRDQRGSRMPSSA